MVTDHNPTLISLLVLKWCIRTKQRSPRASSSPHTIGFFAQHPHLSIERMVSFFNLSTTLSLPSTCSPASFFFTILTRSLRVNVFTLTVPGMHITFNFENILKSLHTTIAHTFKRTLRTQMVWVGWKGFSYSTIILFHKTTAIGLNRKSGLSLPNSFGQEGKYFYDFSFIFFHFSSFHFFFSTFLLFIFFLCPFSMIYNPTLRFFQTLLRNLFYVEYYYDWWKRLVVAKNKHDHGGLLWM